MVSWEAADTCCRTTLFGLDRAYGWAPEATAILLIAFMFNLATKWFVKKLHHHFTQKREFWRDSLIQALYIPLSCYVWFFASLQVIDLLATHLVAPLPASFRSLVLAASVITTIAWFFLRWKRDVVQHMMSRSRNKEIAIDVGRIKALDRLVTVTILFFAILSLLEATHQNISTLIAFGGIGGLALAIASQEIIANLFGGFMIHLTQPFTIGDLISLPERTTEGYVEEIGWYMTRLRSLDKRPIYIPNATFSRLVVITPSRMTHRQFKETLGIRYEDLARVKPVTAGITAMLQEHPDIDKKLPIIVTLTAFGQYSLDIYVCAYTKVTGTEEFMKVKEDILFKIADILLREGTELAFPTQNIALVNPPLKTSP
ncbi:MAG: mechanosensitive ion channel family protein [Parachlamydiaceae bacterium]